MTIVSIYSFTIIAILHWINAWWARILFQLLKIMVPSGCSRDLIRNDNRLVASKRICVKHGCLKCKCFSENPLAPLKSATVMSKSLTISRNVMFSLDADEKWTKITAFYPSLFHSHRFPSISHSLGKIILTEQGIYVTSLCWQYDQW